MCTWKTAQVVRERKYKIDILGLCETWWKGAGKNFINTGGTVLFAGHTVEKVPHNEGVAWMLSKEEEEVWIEWKSLPSMDNNNSNI